MEREKKSANGESMFFFFFSKLSEGIMVIYPIAKQI